MNVSENSRETDEVLLMNTTDFNQWILVLKDTLESYRFHQVQATNTEDGVEYKLMKRYPADGSLNTSITIKEGVTIPEWLTDELYSICIRCDLLDEEEYAAAE